MNKDGWTYKRLDEVCDKGSSNIVINKLESNEGDYPLFGASGIVRSIDFYHRDKPYIGIIKDGSGVGRVNIYPAYSSLVGTMQYILPKDDEQLKYIKYFLQKLDLSQLVTGAAIPHIYFKDYGKKMIPIPSKETQNKIVAEFDSINESITMLKQQVKDLDKLANSIYYTTFGENSTFEKVAIDECVEKMHLGPFGSALKNECFVEKENSYCMVYEQQHAIKHTMDLPTRYVDEAKYKELERFAVKGGDILMSCRGTIGKLFILPDNAPLGIIHPSLMMIRIDKNKVNKIYFIHTLKSIIKDQETNGATVKMAITATKLSQVKIPYPPLNIQQSFASKVASIEEGKTALYKQIEEMQTLLASRMQYWFD